MVKGAECVLPDGSVRRIDAAWTLLATGGFQVTRRCAPNTSTTRPAASNCAPTRTAGAAGSRYGLAAGAAFGKKDAGFYGHLMPAGVSLSDPARFVDLALYFSEHALLFDLTGERFVDETVGDHLTAMALLERPGARGLFVSPDTQVRGSGSPPRTWRGSRAWTSSSCATAPVPGAR